MRGPLSCWLQGIMKRCQTSMWELEVNPKLRLRLHLWPRKDTHASKQSKCQLHKVTVRGDAADQLRHRSQIVVLVQARVFLLPREHLSENQMICTEKALLINSCRTGIRWGRDR